MAKLEKNIANVGSKVGKLGNNLVKQTNGMSKKLLPKKAYNVTHRYMYISFVVFILLLGFLLNWLYKKYGKKENMENKKLDEEDDEDDDSKKLDSDEEDDDEEEEDDEEEDLMGNQLLKKEGIVSELEGFTMY